MIARSAGKIINIVSEYSIFGSAIVPSYGAAKGALLQLTKSLAIELAPFNIRVNAILPGWFNTDLTQVVKTLSLCGVLRRSRCPNAGWAFRESGRVRRSGIFLASQASGFVTGSRVVVDGGYMIR
jgi:2-dehydro-3-deoxy-D-gluconate 5-dehydrogenase